MAAPIQSPAKCEVLSVTRFLNAKGERPAEIHKQIVAVAVTVFTTSINIKNTTFFPKNIYIFCTFLRKIFEVFPNEPSTAGFYNPDEKCLQRGTDWIFK